MRFSEEDGVLSAAQARARTTVGVEDSLIREEMRSIMALIKQRSGYGYSNAYVIAQRRRVNDQVVLLLDHYGYKVKSELREGTVYYDWVISWEK